VLSVAGKGWIGDIGRKCWMVHGGFRRRLEMTEYTGELRAAAGKIIALAGWISGAPKAK